MPNGRRAPTATSGFRPCPIPAHPILKRNSPSYKTAAKLRNPPSDDSSLHPLRRLSVATVLPCLFLSLFFINDHERPFARVNSGPLEGFLADSSSATSSASEARDLRPLSSIRAAFCHVHCSIRSSRVCHPSCICALLSVRHQGDLYRQLCSAGCAMHGRQRFAHTGRGISRFGTFSCTDDDVLNLLQRTSIDVGMLPLRPYKRARSVRFPSHVSRPGSSNPDRSLCLG